MKDENIETKNAEEKNIEVYYHPHPSYIPRSITPGYITINYGGNGRSLSVVIVNDTLRYIAITVKQ